MLTKLTAIAGLLSAAVLATACGPRVEPLLNDVVILDRFEPLLGRPETGYGGQEAVSIQAVTVQHSRRSAVVSHGDLTWQTIETQPTAELLEIFLAVPPEGREDSDAIAVIEHVSQNGATQVLLETPVQATADWQRQRLALPATPGKLLLRSDRPVAWAEPQLLNPSRQSSDLPDLVLISVDTVRADHLSVYGYSRATSPELEKLAAESLVFERSYSASTWTLPSTATMLTGLLPEQHRLKAIKHRLSASAETLAERLQAAGYRTVAITDGGFLGSKWGLAQGFGRYDVTAGEAWHPKDVEQIADAANKLLAENLFSPLFVFVHTYEAHKPYINRENFAKPFLEPSYNGKFRRHANFSSKTPEFLSDADRDRIVALYDGEIRRADHYLGKFLDRLREHDRWPRTGVVVTSDHGEEFLEHGGLDHGFAQVFEENIRVPLIIRPPGGQVPAKRVSHAVSGLDLTPTLLDLAGLDSPELLGRSLLRPEESAAALTLVHGTNSFPDVREERIRLDQDSQAVVLDLLRGETTWFDLTADPAMKVPLSRAFEAPAARASAERLQAIVAWQSRAPLIVRLPEDCREVRIPPTSKVEALGIWSGLQWLPAAEPASGSSSSSVQLSVEAGRSHYLLFTSRSGASALQIELLCGASNAYEPLRLRTRLPDGQPLEWQPFDADLPPIGIVFPSAVRIDPEAAHLGQENLEELRALGYLG